MGHLKMHMILINSFERLLYSEPDFVVTGNVVERLTRSIPINMHHKSYFDDYYTIHICLRNVIF